VLVLPNSPDHIKFGSFILLLATGLAITQISHLSSWKAQLNLGLSLLFMWFLMKVVGVVPSELGELAWRAVFLKLPFLLFPILMISWKPNIEERNKLLDLFLIGCLVAVVSSLFYAGFRTISLMDLKYLTYSNLSPFLDPAYLGMYLNFALFLVIRKFHVGQTKTLNWLMFILFTIFLMLLLSRTAILLFLVNLVYFAYLLIIKSRWQLFLSLTVLVLLASTSVMQNERAVARVKSLADIIYLDKSQLQENSFGLRLLVWNSSFQILKDNLWLGVGSGAEKSALALQFEKDNLKRPLIENYNTHNQFLQTGIAHGIPGLTLFLIALFFPLYLGFKTRNLKLVAFISLCIVSFFTESMLERQAGVFFFAMFYSLMLSKLD